MVIFINKKKAYRQFSFLLDIFISIIYSFIKPADWISLLLLLLNNKYNMQNKRVINEINNPTQKSLCGQNSTIISKSYVPSGFLMQNVSSRSESRDLLPQTSFVSITQLLAQPLAIRWPALLSMDFLNQVSKIFPLGKLLF